MLSGLVWQCSAWMYLFHTVLFSHLGRQTCSRNFAADGIQNFRASNPSFVSGHALPIKISGRNGNKDGDNRRHGPRLHSYERNSSQWLRQALDALLQKYPTSTVECGEDHQVLLEKLRKKWARIAVGNTIVISTANWGYRELVFNFWRHNKRLKITNLFFFAEDCQTYNWIGQCLGYDHVSPPIVGHPFKSLIEFRSVGFGLLMKLRAFYLFLAIQNGYRALLQDSDSVPLQDFIQALPKNYDVVVANDGRRKTSKIFCACLIFLAPGEKSYSLLQKWSEQFRDAEANDQPAWNRALRDVRASEHMKVWVLDVELFPSGEMFARYRNSARWIHANYRVGKANKINFLKENGAWLADLMPSCVEERVSCCIPGSLCSLHLPDATARLEHFMMLSKNLASWYPSPPTSRYAGYSGPWIENVWIREFHRQNYTVSQFESRFGLFIPIFFQWLDFWHFDKTGYFLFLERLRNLLQYQFTYVTVSQNDDGIQGKRKRSLCDLFPSNNVLIFSSGGHGHIPIPLLKQPEPPRIPNPAPMFQLAFAGTVRNLRADLLRLLKQEMGDEFFVYKGAHWREIWDNARFVLTPRGYGRSAFMLYECIQMGYLPVYIYSDVEWLPYKGSLLGDIRSFGFSLHVSNVSKIQTILGSVNDQELNERRRIARQVRLSHFTYNAVMKQISLFLTTPWKSDLRFQDPPLSKETPQT